jgi:stage II sporulation protein R
MQTKKLLPAAIGFLCSIALLFTMSTYATCAALYQDTLRLHIRAASDAEEDQRRKLLVRDRLVTVTAELTADAADARQAAALLEEQLPYLQAEAEAVLREEGCADPVAVEIAAQYFNTRRYRTETGTLTLPAGAYNALVVTIGEGTGHNWWCVLYPSLCLPAAQQEALGRYTESEQQLVTEGYEVRFWLAEIWTRAAAWLDGERLAVR